MSLVHSVLKVARASMLKLGAAPMLGIDLAQWMKRIGARPARQKVQG
jgi:hypothetical protein